MDAVLEICRRLDGLPLAIELAAPRVKMLNPQAMLAQFDRRFDWAARGAQPSRQTLRGALEWSYNLLSENKQVLLRRLSIFAGSWTRNQRCLAPTSETFTSPATASKADIFDLLMQLVVDRSSSPKRLRMKPLPRNHPCLYAGKVTAICWRGRN
jgi:hypothetical protein